MDEIKDKISVITVCYNCKDDLQRTINSVLCQTYKNIEYLVIDGNSNDGSKDIIKKYQSKIDFYISEPDEGIYDAMNKGIKHSTGKWLIFMNAGDIFCDENVLSKIFSENIPTFTKFIYSDYLMVQNNGNIHTYHTNRTLGIVHHQSSLYKKELHNQYGYYIVTHPYIISDLMFFLSIPEKYYYKTNTKIATIKDDGVSTGTWARTQASCLRHIYGINTFPYIIYDYIKMNVGILCRSFHFFCKLTKKYIPLHKI